MAAKPTPSRQQKQLAVLIDADNASAEIVEGLFEEVAKYGVASVKRIYGDWTGPQLGGWKKTLLDHSIQPIQQFAYTSGKNATDSALIIDAMDLLYTRRFDGFCLVSSDSDFTRLAARLREEGLEVIGFGEQKTPKPFVKACDKFIYTELLRPEETSVDVPAVPVSSAPPSPAQKAAIAVATAAPVKQKAPVDFIAKVIEDNSEEDGWIHLGALGHNLSKLRPDFDSRLYGHAKLSGLIKAYHQRFELEERGGSNGAGGGKSVYARNRKPTAKPAQAHA